MVEQFLIKILSFFYFKNGNQSKKKSKKIKSIDKVYKKKRERERVILNLQFLIFCFQNGLLIKNLISKNICNVYII